MLQEWSGCDSEGLRVQDVAWPASDQAAVRKFRFRQESAQPIIAETSPFGGAAKRGLDLMISLFLLPIAAIVALPIACLVALDGGSVLYGQERVGWSGRLFRCYKFRTMSVGAEDELATILERDLIARREWLDSFKLQSDPRATLFGRWLRKTYLDEIPQVWNVLRGDMSWVGPRPIVTDEMEKYGVFLPAYLACRPGISGLWQINRRSDTTYIQRVDFDVQYARKWSVARDVTILLLTIPRILFAGNGGC